MHFYGIVSGFNPNKTIFSTCLQRSRTEQLQTALDLVERGVDCVSRGRARSLYGGSAVFDEVFMQASFVAKQALLTFCYWYNKHAL